MAYNNTAKIIRSRDLEAISWVTTASPVGLSDREMRLFQVFVSALRMNPGSNIMRTTIGELSRAHVNAHVMSSCSMSTARRALAGLEAKGYLIRKNCRLGNASRGLEIVFQLDRWAYWTQSRFGNVTPIPTSVHIPVRQSMRPAEEWTKTIPVVNSQDLPKSVNNMHKKRIKKSYKYHPILFTLWCVLKKDGIRIPAADPVYVRAKLEIEAAGAGVEISNHSGVPWPQYEKSWREMLPPTRETFAKSQILPFLRSSPDMCDNVVSRETMCDYVGQERGYSSAEPIVPAPPGETSEQIQSLIAQSLESVSIPKAPSPAPAPNEYPDIDLNDPDFKLLAELRDRSRARGVNTG